MRETKYLVKVTSQFKKDYKLAMKRGLKIVGCNKCRVIMGVMSIISAVLQLFLL